MIKKTGILITLVAMLALGSAYAQEQDIDQEIVQVYELSVEEAVDLGLKNNESIKTAQLDIERNQVLYKKTSDQWSKAEDSSIIETKLLSDGYYKRQANMAVTVSKKSKELTESKIALGIRNGYYEIARSLKDIEVKKKNMERVLGQLNIAEVKLKAGTGIRQEVLTAEAAVEEAKLALANAEDDLKYGRMEFNKLLGLPVNAEVVLTDDVLNINAAIDMNSINLEEKVALAKKERFEMVQARENLEVAQLYFDIVSGYRAQNTYDYRDANYQKESAVNKLNEAETTVGLSVNKAYFDMQKAARSVSVYDKNIQTLEEAYRLSQLSYEAGMGVQMDVLNAQKMLYDAELARIEMIHSYNLAKLSFEASYGIGN